MALEQQIHQIGRNARDAARALAGLQTERRNAILRAMAGELLARAPQLLDANAEDVSLAAEHGLSTAAIDRLRLYCGSTTCSRTSRQLPTSTSTGTPSSRSAGPIRPPTSSSVRRVHARQAGLRRRIVPVPLLTPPLSSLWLGLITPVYARVGRKLIESLPHETVVRDTTALRTFPIRAGAAIARPSHARLCTRIASSPRRAGRTRCPPPG